MELRAFPRDFPLPYRLTLEINKQGTRIYIRKYIFQYFLKTINVGNIFIVGIYEFQIHGHVEWFIKNEK